MDFHGGRLHYEMDRTLRIECCHSQKMRSNSILGDVFLRYSPLMRIISDNDAYFPSGVIQKQCYTWMKLFHTDGCEIRTIDDTRRYQTCH